METPEINFEDFDLPFVKNEENGIDDEDDEDSTSKLEELESMQTLIPKNVRFLGKLGNEIAHSPGLTWETDDYYYIMPWEGAGYDWAMFRITWDDNWGRYEWSMDARIRGVKDVGDAARVTFKALVERWGYDLKDTEWTQYKRFLDKLGG